MPGVAQPDPYAPGIPTEHTRWFTRVGSSRSGVGTPVHRDADAIAANVLRPLDRPAGDAHSDPARQAGESTAGQPKRRSVLEPGPGRSHDDRHRQPRWWRA